jgi:hypothetical protein
MLKAGIVRKMVRMSDALSSHGAEATRAAHRPTGDIMRARIEESIRTMFFLQVPAIDLLQSLSESTMFHFSVSMPA